MTPGVGAGVGAEPVGAGVGPVVGPDVGSGVTVVKQKLHDLGHASLIVRLL